MASYYCVVRFVPSALAEEFVNIGVLAFGDGQVRGKFLENWHRVQKFSTVDVNAAREFQEWVEESMVSTQPKTGQPKLDENTVRRIANEWAGSVQLSEPRASLLTPDDLLEQIEPRYLHR